MTAGPPLFVHQTVSLPASSSPPTTQSRSCLSHRAFTHPSQRRPQRRLRYTPTATVEVPPVKQLSPAEELIRTIERAFKSGDTSGVEPVLDVNCVWDTPVTQFGGRAEIVTNFQEFIQFVREPAIEFEPVEELGTAFGIRWTVSFIWPLPWVPRVTFSGRTRVSLDWQGLVSRWEDTWDVSPFTVLRQTLPRFSDIYWLYASPHAETNAGVRRVLARRKGYDILQQAAGWEVVGDEYEKDICVPTIYVTPTLPPDMFCGQVRRKEVYATVSPVSVRRTGDGRVEWSVPVPGRYIGTGGGLPVQKSKMSRIERRDRRILAAMRWRGPTFEEKFEKKLEELLSMLRRDGVLEEGQKVERGKIHFSYYDSKIGFNSKGQLSIAAFFCLPFLKSLDELTVELPGLPSGPDVDADW